MTTNIAHASPPTICEHCLAVVYSRIPAGESLCSVILPCRHQPGGVIVATAYVVGGVIEQWDISGPMSEERATITAQQFYKASQAAGGQVQEFRTRRH